jgi:hypothetical protein
MRIRVWRTSECFGEVCPQCGGPLPETEVWTARTATFFCCAACALAGTGYADLSAAIEALDARGEEIEALLAILSQEGFGGREDIATTDTACQLLAEERLVWLRDTRIADERSAGR